MEAKPKQPSSYQHHDRAGTMEAAFPSTISPVPKFLQHSKQDKDDRCKEGKEVPCHSSPVCQPKMASKESALPNRPMFTVRRCRMGISPISQIASEVNAMYSDVGKRLIFQAKFRW